MIDQVLGQEGKSHVTPHFFSAAIVVNQSLDQEAPGTAQVVCAHRFTLLSWQVKTTHIALRASIALLQ